MIRFLDKSRGVAIIGSDIVFSQDGGKHWQRSTIRSSTKFLPAVSMQFRGHAGWIGAHGEILHTVDAGEHWEEIVAVRTIWSKELGFGPWGTVHFISEATGFTLGGDGELFETMNGGKTWTKVALPERIVSLSCAEDVCWLASNEKLYRLEAE